jgi:hypothetical protein
MAQTTQKTKQLAELIRQAEASRLSLTESHARIRRSLDVPTRLRASVAGAPSKWLGSSLVAGLATSFLFRPGRRKAAERAKKAVKRRGLAFGLLTMLFTLSKPALKIYAMNLLREYVARRLTGATPHRPPY